MFVSVFKKLFYFSSFTHLFTSSYSSSSPHLFLFFSGTASKFSSPMVAATTAWILVWKVSDDKARDRRKRRGKKKRTRTSGDFQTSMGSSDIFTASLTFSLFQPYLGTSLLFLNYIFCFPPCAFSEGRRMEQEALNFMTPADFTHWAFTPAWGGDRAQTTRRSRFEAQQERAHGKYLERLLTYWEGDWKGIHKTEGLQEIECAKINTTCSIKG